ncbi:FeoB-associated Cys-rich membrane protein [Vibrio sp. SCSIO 43136]|nr:FeoB-associated Cys-rich membrane protein [Vibrio sp. SCSIO 43136]USD67081.1 FeoB-associated Cys-rich membrane protein [Vibrio sp. SCSIO 43136]
MTNIIVSLIILLIVGLAIYKVVSEKRKGTKCVGCAHSQSCSSDKNSSPC